VFLVPAAGNNRPASPAETHRLTTNQPTKPSHTSTRQDKAALQQFGAPNGVDYVALSFTRSADDVKEARAYLNAAGMVATKIIAKIENKVG
jgi:pyruvate kinase